jgi:hypothetical protein
MGTLLVALVAAYWIIAPDSATLTATRAVAGAVAGGVRAHRATRTPAAAGHHPAVKTQVKAGEPVSPKGKAKAAAAAKVTGTSGTATTGAAATAAGGPPATTGATFTGRRPAPGAGFWPRARAVAVGGWQGGREQVARARAARAEGTDLLGRTTRAGSWAKATAGRAAKAGRATFGRLLGAVGAWKANQDKPWWSRLRKAAAGAKTNPLASTATSTNPAATNPAAGGPNEQANSQVSPGVGTDSSTTPSVVDPYAPVEFMAEVEPYGKEFINVNGIQLTDLESVEDLRAEVTQVRDLLEELADSLTLITGWATGLPDRLDAAPFETARIIQAAATIFETIGQITQVDDCVEALEEMDPAVVEAEGLGEDAAGIGARGSIEAFQSA